MTFEYEIIFFITWLTKLVIFQQVSQYKFKLPVLFTIPLVFTLVAYFYYDVVFWGEIFFLPVIALFIKQKENWNWTQYFFYSFFALVVDDIISRLLGVYVKFAFHNIFDELTFDLMGWSATFLSLPLYFIFLKVANLDVNSFKNNFKVNKFSDLSRIIKIYNFSLIVYFTVMYVLASLPSMADAGWISLQWDDVFYRRLLLFTYTPIFFGFSLDINYTLRKKSEEKIRLVQQEQIVALSSYSQHVEALYGELRSFRHDYANILVSLNLAIEDGDMARVREIYQAVIANSAKPFQDGKYDIAKLSNLQNDAMKGILSAKLMAAQNQGVEVAVEIAEPITAPEMDLMEIIQILSIFLDNAIEATVLAEQPALSVAYFQEGTRKVLVVENTTDQERTDTRTIFRPGKSSKGKGRGIGLANVRAILSKYPNISLNTNSYNYRFSQVLSFDESPKAKN